MGAPRGVEVTFGDFTWTKGWISRKSTVRLSHQGYLAMWANKERTALKAMRTLPEYDERRLNLAKLQPRLKFFFQISLEIVGRKYIHMMLSSLPETMIVLRV